MIHACGRFGLAVVGYSGRDDSVMRALEAALETDGAFPAGLFWFNRSDSPPLARVTGLIERASRAGVSAHLVPIETFDELMGDVMVLVEDIPAEVRGRLDRRASRLSEAPMPPPGGAYPVIRLNALPLTHIPAVCRRVKCGIGGAKEVRDAVAQAEADLIVGRRQSGVLAFGTNAEIRRVFSPHAIETFDLQDFQSHRLRYTDSVETGMLLEALTRSLSRERPVRAEIRRSRNTRYTIVADASRAEDPLLESLRRAVRTVAGKVPKTDLEWAESVQLRLDYRLDRLWLLLLPSLWVERTEDEAAFELAREFSRERLAVRRNAESNAVLDAWVQVVLGGEGAAQLAAFGLTEGEGVDAQFTIGSRTAFSRRTAPHPERGLASRTRTHNASTRTGGLRG